MSLRTVAESDLQFILEDDKDGFRWPITIVDPDGVNYAMLGFSNDISFAIDPETGLLINSRHASVALRVQHIYDAGIVLPTAIHQQDRKPWLVKFLDINSIEHIFRVVRQNPDRGLGLVTLVIEEWTI